MKVLLSILLVIGFAQFSRAQNNLVLNSSFELYDDTSVLGIAAFERNYVYFWSDPNQGTSDIFTPNTYPSFTTPPNNAFGFEYPHTGLCYAGFAVYDGFSSLHEYIQASFISPLIAGRTYAIESYVSLGFEGNSLCISDLGFYFSDTQIHVDSSPFGQRIPVIPQFENASTQMINTFQGWQRITGNYAAHGGEQFLNIGIFKPYSMVHTDSCYNYPNGVNFTYLFIDDVAVYDTAKVDTIRLCLNDSVLIGENWQHEQGLYFDTLGGLPVKYYIENRPYSASLTLLTRPFEFGDSTKVPLIQTAGSDSSYEIGLHNYLFVKNDTIIDVPMFNIYGCDSTVRYVCGWHLNLGQQAETKVEWSISPNPSHDFIEIKFTNNISPTYHISIFDITGKEILTQSLQQNKIDVTTLNSGMYFVKLMNAKSTEVLGVKKFVKE